MALHRNAKSDQLSLEELNEMKAAQRIDSVFDLTPDKVECLKRVKPKLLGITCGRADCSKGLHCFDPGRTQLRYSKGCCQQCGTDLVNWDKVWLRDSRDVGAKFEFFETEWIRHFFFHVPLSSRVEKYARQHGLIGLGEIVEHQLRQKKMLTYMPTLDWNQTKMLDGTIVHWARHAVACCCRGCMNYWHNIPLSQDLGEDEVKYFKELALTYISRRMPNLSAVGETAPMAPRA